MTLTRGHVEKIWQRLDLLCRQEAYRGYDPFDGLNSRLFQATPLARWRWARLAWVQGFKRCPVNLRPLVGIDKTANAKTLALLAHSYGWRGCVPERKKVLSELRAMQCDPARWGKGAWGYPFDWQARAFFVPAHHPNLICTAYAAMAVDTPQGYAETARFVRRHLYRPDRAMVAYVAGDDTFVHNVNLWGAFLLLRGGQTRAGLACLRTSLAGQTPDGAWVYGARAHHQYIDSYHTGYVLEALSRIRGLTNVPAELRAQIDRAIDKGMAFYQTHFFDAAGRVGYYHDRLYPLDTHSVAQAIVTLLTVTPTAAQRRRAETVLAFALDHLWDDARGRFLYQKRAFFSNRVGYLRWTQAWMHYALAVWLEQD